MVKKTSYVHIEEFMLDLDLSAGELLTYAIIYGFSQDGKSFFTGSLSYIARWTKKTEKGVWNNLQNLMKKGLIEKKSCKEGALTYCAYRAVFPSQPIEKTSTEKTSHGKNFYGAIEKNSAKEGFPIEKISANTIQGDLNTSDTISIGASAPTPEEAPKPAPEKPQRPALLDREPRNDMERVEKSYLENYMMLKKQGLMKTDKPIINWQQSRKLTKDALEKYGLDSILDAVRKSMDNDFCIQKGYSLTTILSSGVLAGLINGNDWHKGHAIDSVDHPVDMGEVLF